jgi:DNA modification methylase
MTKIDFQQETTTVWSFPVRGTWATHNNKYRGNFAPQLARNVIETYSEPGEVVLDPMAGGGTTLIEAKLLGRGFIGCDINPAAVKLCEKATAFENENDFATERHREHRGIEEKNKNTNEVNTKQLDSRLRGNDKSPTSLRLEGATQKKSTAGGGRATFKDKIVCADVRDLSFLGDGSVDLILTHPPYLNIIHYSDKLDGDLSGISSVKKFCGEMRIIAGELLRVLKPGRYCAILMGDTRRGRHFVPLAYRVMDTFLDAGFILKEDIIKVQHNCSATSRWVGKAKKAGFYLIMHEHLFVFRKADKGEDMGRVRESMHKRIDD